MEYYKRTEQLIASGERTDGCSMPLKNPVHKMLKKSKVLCAFHDFALRGLFPEIKTGLQANWETVKLHFSVNFAYGLWGAFIMLATTPWVIARYHLGMKSVDYIGFHMALLMVIGTPLLIWSKY